MADLWDSKGALFSEDRKYRYALLRNWDLNKPLIMFIGLNPSTANENQDDATIRRVCRFAFDWDFGGVYMMNLFAWVTPYPEELRKVEDPIGDNDKWLIKAQAKCDEVVFCWGNFPEAKERSEQVMKMFPSAKALILNKDGTPRHPLYVPANTVPVEFKR